MKEHIQFQLGGLTVYYYQKTLNISWKKGEEEEEICPCIKRENEFYISFHLVLKWAMNILETNLLFSYIFAKFSRL